MPIAERGSPGGSWRNYGSAGLGCCVAPYRRRKVALVAYVRNVAGLAAETSHGLASGLNQHIHEADRIARTDGTMAQGGMRVGAHSRAPSPPARDRPRAMANPEMEDPLRRILRDCKWTDESAREPRLLSAQCRDSKIMGLLCPTALRGMKYQLPRKSDAPRLFRGRASTRHVRSTSGPLVSRL